MALLVTFVLLALGVSFTCSLMEATILSVSRSYVQSLINKGKPLGTWLFEYKKNIDKPLASILALNTLANTIGATGAGAQAEKVFSSQWLALFVGLFTLSILVFSEIIPKTIGAVYWRKTAPITAYVLKVISPLMLPFIMLSEILTRSLKNKTGASPGVMREEISMMAEIGEDLGALSDWEEKVIQNILLLQNSRVHEILTPRTVMLSLPIDMTVGEVLKKYRSMPFSRIPVFGEDLDDMRGMVLRHDILELGAKDQHSVRMEELLRPIHHVPMSLTIAMVISEFVKRREQMFVVIDEYGGTKGLVTMEDAIESLLGTEIVDEKDPVIDMRALALKIWNRRWRRHAVEDEAEPGEKTEKPGGEEKAEKAGKAEKVEEKEAEE